MTKKKQLKRINKNTIEKIIKGEVEVKKLVNYIEKSKKGLTKEDLTQILINIDDNFKSICKNLDYINKKNIRDDLQSIGSKYSIPTIGLIICCGILVAFFVSILII
jgi:excinuclease UvrABC helicase subunit UvrB